MGIYIARLGSDSISAMWLDDFQRFFGRIRNCGDPGCIEDSLHAVEERAAFIEDYNREHGLAEASLATHLEVSLSPGGFSDAIERTKANLGSTLGTFINKLYLTGGPIGADMDGLSGLLEKYHLAGQ
jgi:hypothetical protein